MAGFDGGLQPTRRFGDGVRLGDADNVETLGRGQIVDDPAQFCRLQKSSSA
jgi:hypothetical protein